MSGKREKVLAACAVAFPSTTTGRTALTDVLAPMEGTDGFARRPLPSLCHDARGIAKPQALEGRGRCAIGW